MIVDDNAEMRTLIRSLLSGVAQDFIECGNGQEAVAAFPAERPDWTVMDVVMAGGDGLSATGQITARFPQARILVISHHQHPAFLDSARGAGAAGFLNKEELTRLPAIITGAAA